MEQRYTISLGSPRQKLRKISVVLPIPGKTHIITIYIVDFHCFNFMRSAEIRQ